MDHPDASSQRLGEAQGRVLLQLARQCLEAQLIGDRPFPEASARPDWLQRPGATFVTLTRDGELRGCLGSLEAHRTLFDDLHHNAVAAATRDPRFAAVTVHELPRLQISVTLLEAPQPMPVAGEADLRQRLRPGVDGLVLSHQGRSATFLPQVWESLPRVEDFLVHLKRKAGWDRDFWHPQMDVSRYQVQTWRETPAESDAPSPAR